MTLTPENAGSSIQDSTAINGFYGLGGQYQFLSNFYQHPFTLGSQPIGSPVAHLVGYQANSVEHFFQAAKTLDVHSAIAVLSAKTSAATKAMGRKVALRPDWEDVKYEAMRAILRSKFKNDQLRSWLAETGTAELIEANHWHDTIWGRCTCAKHQGAGSNYLGQILMELRAEITS